MCWGVCVCVRCACACVCSDQEATGYQAYRQTRKARKVKGISSPYLGSKRLEKQCRIFLDDLLVPPVCCNFE